MSAVPIRDETSEVMAWRLAGYMTCPKAIRERIREEFGQGIGLTGIQNMIDERRAPKQRFRPDYDGNLVWEETVRRDRYALANRRFVEALDKERTRSINARQFAEMARVRGISA